MFTGLLNNECSIILSSMSVSPYGGQTPVRSTIYSQRPCRLQQLSMDERAVLLREGIESSHRVFCEADMTLSTQHEVVISGVTYLVTGFDTPEGALVEHHSEIMVKRLA
ncbi:MAG: hypothetical protein WC359_14305 [Dehalococcoidia bacterium]|jgi:hypothetical protein